jgi:GNAT superfamily N-acetyltransferase
VLRAATADDAAAVAAIWEPAWRDGHLGHIPGALVAVRTSESFRVRAAERVADTTVACVDGAVAGFVMVVGDELEQVYVDPARRGSGVAALILAEGERQVRAAGQRQAWLAVVAGNTRARAFYERGGWRDEGPFEYQAASADGPVPVQAHRYVKDL